MVRLGASLVRSSVFGGSELGESAVVAEKSVEKDCPSLLATLTVLTSGSTNLQRLRPVLLVAVVVLTRAVIERDSVALVGNSAAILWANPSAADWRSDARIARLFFLATRLCHRLLSAIKTESAEPHQHAASYPGATDDTYSRGPRYAHDSALNKALHLLFPEY